MVREAEQQGLYDVPELPVDSLVDQPTPAEQHGPCEACDLSGPEAGRRYHEWAADQPPPADADALRERVLADWADCPYCHHWGHQHRYGVCMVCDKRDQTCGLFALTPPPANADADALREALPERIRQELGGWLVHDPRCWHMTHGCDCGLDDA